ncbi:MAG: NADP-dependent isocitrate dehydrogenase, partial [Proteobacteria bacterium]
EEAANLGVPESDYQYYLIDDAANRLLNPPAGGVALALMNFEGDVWSDLVAGGYGSLALMTSVLVSPSGAEEFEAAHGTVTAHYRRHQRGEETSTNPVALIFAWSGALRRCGFKSDQSELEIFARDLEHATRSTIGAGTMTADLIKLSDHPEKRQVTTREFIAAVAARLEEIRSR